MKMKTYKIEGITPLLMHNVTSLADPISEVSKAIKAISGKRKKTEDDHLAMRRLEFEGGLYLNDKDQPIIPGELFKACLVDSAKIEKLGKEVGRSLTVMNDSIIPKVPKGAQKLFDGGYCDVRSVVIQRSRAMRARPQFKKWSASFAVTWNEQQIDEDVLDRIVKRAGVMSGLCDFRPGTGGRFGMFKVKK